MLDPHTAAVKQVLGELVNPIDGRTKYLCYTANVDTLLQIVERLTAAYGEPTVNHPMLATIKWKTNDNLIIVVPKADSFNTKHTAHSIDVFTC